MQYIQLRNNTFHFRFKIPQHLRPFTSRKELTCSLKTNSYSVACSMVASKLKLINSLGYMALSNEDELESLFNEITDFTGSRARRRRKATTQEQSHQQDHQSDRELHSALRTLFSKILGGQSSDNISVNLSQLLGTTERAETPQEELETTLLLSDAWQQFVDFKSWTEKDFKFNNNFYQFMLAHWGNIDVSTIKKKDIRDALSRFSMMPKGNKAPYNKMTVSERYMASEACLPDDDLVSPTTVKHLLKVLQSFFSAYLTNEIDVFDKSPTDGVKHEASGVRYGIYTDKEIRTIKQYALEQTHSWKRWTLLLGIYTGARASEVAKFLKDGVKFDKETGRYYFELKEGKTVNAIRKVPVHKELERLGVCSVSGIEIKNKMISHWMTRTLAVLGISEYDNEGCKRLYHSFRHTFITKAVAKGCQMELIQEVVGHSKRVGITSRYIHKLKLPDVIPVIDSIGY